VNSGGVMPIIFAQSILSAPMLLGTSSFVQNNRYLNGIYQALAPGMPWYIMLTIIGIIFFAYFYVSIVMRPDDIADNFRKSGSFIPGIRPGRRTSDFINDILTRVTLVGAIYLVLVTLLPTWLISGIRFDKVWLIGHFFENLPNWVTHGMNVNFYFGGTSLLIVVGVAMDTIMQVESQLVMRHYDGFSPRSGRVRGRKTW
jgi:preprotein translocase subunit SecY